MTTRSTASGISQLLAQLNETEHVHSQGEKPCPDAKDAMAGIGDLVNPGGKTNQK